MKLERSDVNFPLWRKKVDSSLFKKEHTPIPNWCAKQWNMENVFGKNTLTKNPVSEVRLEFERKIYNAWVTYSFNKDTNYQLWLSKNFVLRLKDVFIMSYMRSLEQRLRKAIGSNYQEVENEMPFWEFLDLEFNHLDKIFYCKSHYFQKPIFPLLFRQFIKSHILKEIENNFLNKGNFKFVKGDWLHRSEINTFLEARNIIYYLLDTENKLLYIGEAEHSSRIFTGRIEIPSWNYFRVDFLPSWLTKSQRLELERLIIRSFASILINKKNINTRSISDYILVNKKIDN